MRFYIATKLENHKEHNRLRDILVSNGHICTYDWTVHGPVYKEGLKRIREIAKLEYQGIVTADVVIVLWPGGRGTHVELGMAIALGRICHLVSEVNEHHEASQETCAFYHHPRVKLHKSIASLVQEII